MPHCPRCEKRFPTLQKLVRHINQTSSSCANLIDDLITLSRPLQPSSRQNLGPQLEPECFSDNFPDNHDFDTPLHGDIEMAPPNFEPYNPSDTNESKYR